MLDTAIQEKHPAKLGIDALDQNLETTLLKAFHNDIIFLSDQRKKNLENIEKGYYYNFDLSYLIHCCVE